MDKLGAVEQLQRHVWCGQPGTHAVLHAGHVRHVQSGNSTGPALPEWSDPNTDDTHMHQWFCMLHKEMPRYLGSRLG